MNAITVEGLGKRYVIGHEQRADTLRDAVSHGVRGWWQRLRAGAASRRSTTEEFWALREVSFGIAPGEVVGVIGRNGAGKSTLLKILSRITEPTCGCVRLRGRVASLLEVGTGFHPELTGRENIFLNGAILGMSRAEIRRKFDEIVAFSEIERFLDTPVKRYSSGMYVRLAFAVAAHLEPEILIVDEVLAVGDAEFQRKCLGRMEQVVRDEGRTVLFVSHNLAAVRQLCRRALLLTAGRLTAVGPTATVLEQYQSLRPVQASLIRGTGSHSTDATISRVAILDRHGHTLEHFNSGEPISVLIELEVRVGLPPVQLAVRLSTFDGVAVLTTTNADALGALAPIPIGRHEFRFTLPSWLAPGTYSLKIALCEPQRRIFDAIDDEICFEVTAVGSATATLHDDRRGFVAPVLTWQQRTL